MMQGVETRKSVTHKSLKVKHREGVPKKRVVHALGGTGPATLYNVHNSSLANLSRGVVERIFCVDYGEGLTTPIRPSSHGFRKSTGAAYSYLRYNAPQLRRWSVSRFIEHYETAQLRVRYTQAAESVQMSRVTRRDAQVKTFVKAEKVNFTAKNDPAPRIISPRDPRYNLELGRYIKPIEGCLYRLLNDMCGGKTVMKGLNSLETGGAIREAWDSFSRPVAIPLDAKRFDQHTGPHALEFESLVYRLFFSGCEKEELIEFLRWQQESECRGYLPEAVVKFAMRIRASGDMNTGLGTCLIACSIIYSYMNTKPVAHWRLVNNGDDCVLILESEDLRHADGLFRWCKMAGYYMVIEKPVYIFEAIEFCQCRPVQTVGGWRMVRTFPESLAKDMVSMLPLTTTKAWKKWAHDIGYCGLALNSGVPVLQEFYTRILRAGDGSWGDHPSLMRSGMVRQARGLESRSASVSEEARVSFWEAFGVSPKEQIAIEDHLKTFDICLEPGRVGNYSVDTLTERIHSYYSAIINITQN